MLKIFASILLSFLIIASYSEAQSFQVTLGWNPPTANADGTPLTDLSFYRVKRSTVSGNYSNGNITVVNSGTTQSVASGLNYNTTYYFVVTAVDTSGNESIQSNQVSLFRTAPTPTPTATATPTPTATLTATPTATPTSVPTAVPTAVPTIVSVPDTDGDGVADSKDNCVSIANTDQADLDKDGVGDLCETESAPDFNRDGRADGLRIGGTSVDIRLGTDSGFNTRIARKLKGAVKSGLSADGSKLVYVKRKSSSYEWFDYKPLTDATESIGTFGSIRGSTPALGCVEPAVFMKKTRSTPAMFRIRAGSTFTDTELPAGTTEVICSTGAVGKMQLLAKTKSGRDTVLALVGTNISFKLPRAISALTIHQIPESDRFAVTYVEARKFKFLIFDRTANTPTPQILNTSVSGTSILRVNVNAAGDSYFLLYRRAKFEKATL